MQLLINIVVLASIYALIACGYVMIYRVSRVLNLAHGELMMLGAYLLLATASLFSGHAVVALGAAVVLSLVVGLLVYVFLMRKMTGEMVLAAILTTVALGILIRGLVVLLDALVETLTAIGYRTAALPDGAVWGIKHRFALLGHVDDARRIDGEIGWPAIDRGMVEFVIASMDD